MDVEQKEGLQSSSSSSSSSLSSSITKKDGVKIVTQATNVLGDIGTEFGGGSNSKALQSLEELGIRAYNPDELERNVVQQLESQFEEYVDPLDRFILDRGLDQLVTETGDSGQAISHMALKNMIRILEVNVSNQLRRKQSQNSDGSITRVEELQIKVQLLRVILNRSEQKYERARAEERKRQAEIARRLELERLKELERARKEELKQQERDRKAAEEKMLLREQQKKKRKKEKQAQDPFDPFAPKPPTATKRKIGYVGGDIQKKVNKATKKVSSDAVSSSPSHIEDPSSSMAECPICFRKFPADHIENHANRCLTRKRVANPTMGADIVEQNGGNDENYFGSDLENVDNDEDEEEESSSIQPDADDKLLVQESKNTKTTPLRRNSSTGSSTTAGSVLRRTRGHGTIMDDYKPTDYNDRLREYRIVEKKWARNWKLGRDLGKESDEADQFAQDAENEPDSDNDDVEEEEQDMDDRKQQEEEGPTSPRNNDNPTFVMVGGTLKFSRRSFHKLFPYQRDAMEWFWKLHRQGAGGILGDEMGLGKTVQVASFLGALKYQRLLKPSIIVCPATTVSQWTHELHKWAPTLRVFVLHSTGAAISVGGWTKDKLVLSAVRHGDVIVTTYNGLRMNQNLLLRQRWGYIILDEGHKIRNPDAEITLVCKRFQTVHRIVLTGSPIQNNLKELWSLFDFVCPGRLGTLPMFESQFSIPINAGGYANATSQAVHMAYQCAKVLKEQIDPHLLRRMKKDVATQLPEKVEHVLFCNLTKLQREAYKEFLSQPEVEEMVASEPGSQQRRTTFKFIRALQHICNHPDIYREKLRQVESQRLGKSSSFLSTILADGEQDADEVDTMDTDNIGGDEAVEEFIQKSPIEKLINRSGKLMVLRIIMRKWKEQGHRVLLFSQGRLMLDILERFVKAEGYPYLRMDGTTTVKARGPLIDHFNDPSSGVFVFLLTTKVGGLGINLIGADRVILYDPDWNPSTDIQARERAWRIGQTKQVTIYRMITSGTIEEKIYHRQIFKQYLTNKILTNPKQRKFFKQANMRDLFTLDEAAAGGEASNAPSERQRERQLQDLRRRIAHRRKLAARNGGATTTPAKRPIVDDRELTAEELNEDLQAAEEAATKIENDTETSDLFGDGKVDPKQQGSDDNSNILLSLFNQEGFRQAFHHDTVERASSASTDHRLIDMEARRVSQNAARALRLQQQQLQRNSSTVGLPTWTGRSGVAGRIGGQHSSQLLGQIRNRNISRNTDESQVHALVNNAGSDPTMILLNRLKDFLQNDPRSTSDILDEFSTQNQVSPSTFRGLLHEVAELDDGLWHLKSEYQ